MTLLQCELNLGDVLGHRPSVALFNVKADLLTFSETFEPRHVDRGVVHKYILPVFLCNEAESLFITKPFYCSLCQSADPLSKKFYMVPKLRPPPYQRKRSFRAKPTH